MFCWTRELGCMHSLQSFVLSLMILNNKSDLRVSFVQLHNQEKRATPMNFAKYKLSIQLHKIYNGNNENDDWQDMNVQQNFNARNENFHVIDCSNLRVGKNILCNRLTCLNNEIKLDWLNLSLTAFKLKAKSIFCDIELTINTC